MEFSAKINHPKLVELYHYWLSKRGDRRMPSRADIEPMELRSLLPNIILMDVLEPGKTYRYRLVGTAVEEAIGIGLTGKLLSEVATGRLFDFISHIFHDVSVHRTICYFESNLGFKEDFSVMYRRLLMPLSTDGSNVDMMLGALIPEWTKAYRYAYFELKEKLNVYEEHSVNKLPLLATA